MKKLFNVVLSDFYPIFIIYELKCIYTSNFNGRIGGISEQIGKRGRRTE